MPGDGPRSSTGHDGKPGAQATSQDNVGVRGSTCHAKRGGRVPRDVGGALRDQKADEVSQFYLLRDQGNVTQLLAVRATQHSSRVTTASTFRNTMYNYITTSRFLVPTTLQFTMKGAAISRLFCSSRVMS